MAIELITGTPGAGKTCYAVNERLLPESGREFKVTDPESPYFGQTIKRRIVMAGIKDLVVDHERIPHKLTGEKVLDADIDRWNEMLSDDVPKFQRLPGQPPVNCEPLVQNWWLWCQPGDLIVVDEAQYALPRGTMGRKPPYFVMALDIHRHYAVDFIFITQHPNKIATEVRGLVGLHRHVRGVMGLPLTMLYTWDHASNPDRFTLATKSSWLRRPKHYKTYKSAVAHLSPPASSRSVFFIIPALIAVLCLGLWMFSAKWRKEPTPSLIAQAHAAPKSAPGQPQPTPVSTSAHPKIRGCWATAKTCQCQGDDGRPIRVDERSCRTAAAGFDGLIEWEPRSSPPVVATPAPVPATAEPAKPPLPFL